MRRLCSLLGLLLGLAACRIEPTPEQYIDPAARASESTSATQAELRSRLATIADALRDGSVQRLTSTLSPHPDGILLGPDAQEPVPAEQLAPLLQREAQGGPLTTEDILVAVDSTNRVAWFVSRFVPRDSVTGNGVPAGFDFSGVFVREAGGWRLIQGHVSRRLNVPPPVPQVSRP